MGHDEDRDAILERRKRLLASALSGVAMGAFGFGAQACACLSISDDDAGVRRMDASPQPCLSDAGLLPDAGPQDAGHDAGDDAGDDAAVDASLDAALDGAVDDGAVDAG